MAKNIQNPSHKVLTIGEFLQNGKLKIPPYQRPYKWTTKNVIQLIDDLFTHKAKTAYRLGTVVIHEENKEYNIVDGQQRTITLILITRAILKHKRKELKNPELKRLMDELDSCIIDPEFSNEISRFNIVTNYREIERQVKAMDEETIIFLYKKCEFIQFVLTDISEAFQFFDSQNARGKDLEPHDLLKAYHLREFSKRDEELKSETVKAWELMETADLTKLFGEYLYRIKGWSKGVSARYFTKDEVGLFKGVNLEKIENYPYTNLIRIAHFYVDRYNNSYERNIDLNKSAFPFQLDQPIINGRRFFEMIT